MLEFFISSSSSADVELQTLRAATRGGEKESRTCRLFKPVWERDGGGGLVGSRNRCCLFSRGSAVEVCNGTPPIAPGVQNDRLTNIQLELHQYSLQICVNGLHVHAPPPLIPSFVVITATTGSLIISQNFLPHGQIFFKRAETSDREFLF